MGVDGHAGGMEGHVESLRAANGSRLPLPPHAASPGERRPLCGPFLQLPPPPPRSVASLLPIGSLPAPNALAALYSITARAASPPSRRPSLVNPTPHLTRSTTPPTARPAAAAAPPAPGW